jgi:hypothetical protein
MCWAVNLAPRAAVCPGGGLVTCHRYNSTAALGSRWWFGLDWVILVCRLLVWVRLGYWRGVG